MQCLNINHPETKAALEELTNILGDYDTAYYVLSENNGYSLDYAPNGVLSKLFSDLLNYYGDRNKALREKASTFSSQFLKTSSDENGEPTFNSMVKTTSRSIQKKLDKTNERIEAVSRLISNVFLGVPKNPKTRGAHLNQSYNMILGRILRKVGLFDENVLFDEYDLIRGDLSLDELYDQIDFAVNNAQRIWRKKLIRLHERLENKKQNQQWLEYHTKKDFLNRKDASAIELYSEEQKQIIKKAFPKFFKESKATDKQLFYLYSKRLKEPETEKLSKYQRMGINSQIRHLNTLMDFSKMVPNWKSMLKTYLETTLKREVVFERGESNKPLVQELSQDELSQAKYQIYSKYFDKVLKTIKETSVTHKATSPFDIDDSDNGLVFGQTDSKSILLKIKEFGGELSKLASLLYERIHDVNLPIYYMFKTTNRYSNSNVGGYHTRNGIAIYEDAVDLCKSQNPEDAFQRIVLHEIIHSLSVRTIYEDNALSKFFNYLVDKLKPLTDEYHYGFTNAYEFISEFFTNKDFIDFLKSVPPVLLLEQHATVLTMYEQIASIYTNEFTTNAYDALLPLMMNVLDKSQFLSASFIALLYIESHKSNYLSAPQPINQRRQNRTPEDHKISSRLSTVLQRLFPEISVEYVESLGDGYAGQIDLNALQVLIDIDKYTPDTLPHEYAHYYVAMFANSELVQKGIEMFGSEEALVQAIGERTVVMDGNARSWWQKFIDFIKKTLNKNKYAKQALVAELTDAFLTRLSLSDQMTVEGVRHQIISEARNVLSRVQSNIRFDSDAHKYYNNQTGAPLEAVSDIKKRLGYDTYDSSYEDEEQSLLSEEARNAGTSIHEAFEQMFLGKFDRSHFAGFSDQAINNIQSIVDELKKNYEFVASEAMIADFDKNVAGTCDLLLRNKRTGKYVLMDYKTKLNKLNGQTKKKNGKPFYGFKYINSTKFSSKSQRDAYDFQLSAYQYMLQKHGIEIEKRCIIPLLYERTGDKIDAVYLSKTMGGEDISSKGYYEVNEAESTRYDVEIKVFNDNTNVNVSMAYLKSLSSKLTPLIESIRGQITNVSQLFRLKGYNQQYKQTEAILDKMGNANEVDIFMSYLTLVSDQLKKFVSTIEQRYQDFDNAEWDLDILTNYKEIASSYNLIALISNIVREFPKTFTKEQRDTITKACKDAANLQSTIISAYDSIVGEKFMEIIRPYVNNIKAQYITRARNEYFKTHKEINLADLQAYIQNYLDRHADEIQEETRLWLQRQRSIADSSFECSQLMAQFGSVYTSKHPIVQAVVAMFDDTMRKKDQEAIVWRNKLSVLIKEYAKQYGGSNFADQLKLYEDLVEIIDGQAYLVSPAANSYIHERDKARREIYRSTETTDAEKKDAWQSWLDANSVISDVENYNNEYKQGLEAIIQHMKPSDKLEIRRNAYSKGKDKRKWYYYHKKGILTLELVNALTDMEDELDNKYRVPLRSKYKNEKYDKLMQLQKSNDVKYRLWQFLYDASVRGDEGVPRNKKLNGRLPGIRKTGMERINENGVMSGTADAGRNWLKEHTMMRSDQDERNDTYVNINGEKVHQIPLFYTSRMDVEEQSFDLGTIFDKWYDQTLEYKAKREIRAYMQYTAYMLKTGKVETKEASKLNKLSAAVTGRTVLENATKEITNTLTQYNAFVDQVFYGNSMEDLGTTGKLDNAKVLNALTKYYSLRVMGINYISMFNNALVGEAQLAVEAFAGQYVSKSSYTKASGLYMKNIFGMLADIGRRAPEHKYNRLVEWFGVFSPKPSNMRATGIMRHGITEMSYWTTDVGERELLTRFLLAALIEKKAKDENGKELGSMLDFIDFDKDGHLTVDPKVANFDEAELNKFARQIKVTSAYMHGVYNERMKVAAQHQWWGRLILMMRKWIAPGYQRRFTTKYYDNIRDTYSEGFYKTGMRYYASNPAATAILHFFGSVANSAKLKQLEATRWSLMEDWEKQNVIRFTTELGLMAFAVVVGSVLSGLAGSAGDDDDPMALFILNMDYQMDRLWSDLTFYWNPASLLRILQDPFPTMNMLDNIVRLFDQMFDPFEEYKYGRRKGRNKLLHQTMLMLPIVRQYERYSNIAQEMELFNSLY